MASLSEIETYRAFMKEDPQELMEYLFGKYQKIRNQPVTFFDYQLDYVTDDSRFKIMCCGRQVGKSTMSAAEAVVKAYLTDGYDILIIAHRKKQVYEMFNRIKEMIFTTPLVSDYLVKNNYEEIKFKNNSRIMCITADAESARGFTADLILMDEASFIPDEVYDAVTPMVAVRRGSIRLTGTPNLKEGFFYKIWSTDFEEINRQLEKEGLEPIPVWNKYYVPTKANELIEDSYLRQKRMELSPSSYAREYEGEFVDDNEEALFNPVAVDRCAVGRPKKPMHSIYDYYVGVDVARGGKDSTAIVVFGIPKDAENLGEIEKIEMAHLKCWKTNWLGETRKAIEKLDLIWKPKKIYVDEESFGAGLIEMLQEKLNAYDRVEGVKLRGDDRLDSYTLVAEMIESQKVILINDKTLKEHFKNYNLVRNKTGKLGVEKKASGHDDISDACVIAISRMAKKLGTGSGNIELLEALDFDALTMSSEAITLNPSTYIRGSTRGGGY